MQFQSDVLNTKVVRPIITETTALGAAYLAGLAVGFWSSVDAIREQWQVDRAFSSTIDAHTREALTKGWHQAVQASLAIA